MSVSLRGISLIKNPPGCGISSTKSKKLQDLDSAEKTNKKV